MIDRKRRIAAIGMLLIALCGGCSGPGSDKNESEPNPAPTQPIRVLLIDEPELADPLRRHWSAQSRGELEIIEKTSDELLEDATNRPAADVIIYPSFLLGELVERDIVSSLPPSLLSGDQFDSRDLFRLEQVAAPRWGAETYAVSLGSPQYVLIYRKDLFDEAGIRVPRTWDEYDQVVGELNVFLLLESESGAWPHLATCEPLAAGWAGRTLIVRSAGYVRHHSRYSALFDYASFEPMIDKPPFERALRQCIKNHAVYLPLMTPAETLEAVLEGRAAMALTIIPPAGIDLGNAEAASFSVSVAAVPGSAVFYSFGDSRWERRSRDDDGVIPVLCIEGRLASVVNLSRRSGRAQQFLIWLAGKEMPNQVLTRCGHVSLFRSSQVTMEQQWVDSRLPDAAKRDYVQVVKDLMSRNVWMSIPRIPNGQQYLQPLDEQVRNAIESKADPADALAQVKQRWVEITGDSGNERARQYQSSLGLD